MTTFDQRQAEVERTWPDDARYAQLVQEVRRARGLAPLPQVLPVDDPRPLIKAMEWQLADLATREELSGRGIE